jgi:hypothetical protein
MRLPITTSAELNRLIVQVAIGLSVFRQQVSKRVKQAKRDPQWLTVSNRVKRCRFRVCRSVRRTRERIRTFTTKLRQR